VKDPGLREIPHKLLWGLVFSLVAACFAATMVGCALDPAHSSSIVVIGLGIGPDDEFLYSIGNSRTSANGQVYEFKIGSSKSKFFDGLRKSYRVFAESEDRIQLIYNSEVYTVGRYADGHYALYGEYFMLTDSDGGQWKFPFPTDKIIALGENASPIPYEGTEFNVTCDLPYLLRFYEVYGDAVKVEGNRITWAGTTITVGDGGLIEVDMP
jgi:hypothetical protein